MILQVFMILQNFSDFLYELKHFFFRNTEKKFTSRILYMNSEISKISHFIISKTKFIKFEKI